MMFFIRWLGGIAVLLMLLVVRPISAQFTGIINTINLDCSNDTLTVTYTTSGASGAALIVVTDLDGDTYPVGLGIQMTPSANTVTAELVGMANGMELAALLAVLGEVDGENVLIDADLAFLTYDCAEAANRPLFTDGRICWNRDYVVYTPQDAGIHVYRTEGRTGVLQVYASPEQLAALPAQPAQNTLIAERGGYALYKLTTGEYQLNVGPDFEGKVFTCRWSGLPAVGSGENGTFFDR